MECGELLVDDERLCSSVVRAVERQSKDLGSNPSQVKSVFFSTERFSNSLNIILNFHLILSFTLTKRLSVYSKYSPPVSIHLLQRFNSDSNACSSSFCGIASSDCVVAVLMIEMSLKKHPFNFNVGNREESHGTKSGE